MKQYVPSLMAVIGMILLTGCASVQRGIPVAPSTINTQLQRADVEVLDNVQGSSETFLFMMGVFQVIDGDKIKVLGIPLGFEDQYSLMGPPTGLEALLGPNTLDRAYYQALGKTPDADAVCAKSYTIQRSGIPFLAAREKVTFTGKALKYKADK